MTNSDKDKGTASSDLDEQDAPAPGLAADGGSDDEAEAEADSPADEPSEPAAARARAPGRPEPSPALDKRSMGWRGAPGWVVPLYGVGLVLVFLGQRALSAFETAATLLTATGVLAVVMASFVRFSPKFSATGERGSIEALMRVLSLLGLLALAIYGATSDWGQQHLGIATQPLESRERTLGVLSVLWLVLLLVAVVPMAFAEASLRPMRRAERPESRRVRAAAAAGLTLALAAVYGALFVFSAKAADLKVDYSYFKTSGPSEATKKIAQSLQDQVQITAFFPEVNEVKTEVQGYLQDLGRSAPKLKVEMTDRLLEPKKARDMRATQDGTIVLMKGKVTRSVVVGTEIEPARAKLKTLDRDLQAQLLKLARARRTVYMSVGHGELNDKGANPGEGRSGEIVAELLRRQNYTVKDLGLAQGLGSQVPEDADVILVLGPTEPFAAEEAATLQRYVDKGGKLLLALDPDAVSGIDTVSVKPGEIGGAAAPGASVAAAPAGSVAAAPPSSAAALEPPSAPTPAAGADASLGFAQLLKDVGLVYSPTVLANENAHVRRRFNDSDRVMLVTSSFSSHASVSTLSRNSPRAAIVLSGAGSLEPAEKVATKRKNNLDFTVQAAPDTFADGDRNYQRDKEHEPAKAYNLAAAVSRKLGGKKDEKPKPEPDAKKPSEDGEKDPLEDLNESRVFVVSDSDALSDLVLANVPGNQFFFVDALRWLGGEESWSGEQTTEEDVRIEHTKKEDQVWFYSTIFGAPALVLGAGLMISRRSRQRTARKGGGR